MTNHVHIIAKAREGYLLTNIIRDLKKYTSKQIMKSIAENQQESRKEWMLSIFRKAGEYNTNNTHFQFWRQDNKPIELYSNAVIDQKLHYIHDNPVEAGIVDEPEHYIYSSARDYAGINGILEVELL